MSGASGIESEDGAIDTTYEIGTRRRVGRESYMNNTREEGNEPAQIKS